MTLEERGLVRLRDKLRILYLHYNNTYDHQSWQDGSVTVKSHGHFSTLSWEIKWQTKLNIFVASVPTATKLCEMVTYLDELLLISSHDPLIT